LLKFRLRLTDASAIAAALTGIGPAKAKEIVAYREVFGSFRALEELLAVFCIGAATLEKTEARSLSITTEISCFGRSG